MTQSLQHHIIRQLHSRLSKFVSSPDDFRHLLRDTHSAITGSFALSFINSDWWKPRVMDICVPHEASEAWTSYLTTSQEYRFIREETRPGYEDTIFRATVLFKTGIGTIQIIQSTDSCALRPIPYFWTTFLMNYVAANYICVAYSDTLNRRGHHNDSSPTTIDKRNILLANFATRGYSSVPILPCSGVQECRGWCAHQIRSFADHYTIKYLIGDAHTPDIHSIPSSPVWTLNQCIHNESCIVGTLDICNC
ncbi:hypothetical protein EW146_g8176 [Bondarzewia mesenterica]|uniref:Uncharacterized protein n=1 Tax=Bondarzewia mesenterica TaxID=1095465 RepID=A0A4V3XDU5_9AGAM|nr:hypothetical protein EW146_g8176 [Bondarzewia mesenterica]